MWWAPIYPAPLYRTWTHRRLFRLSNALRFFLVNRFPEPINDRDPLRW
jgi:hypothetical protein